RVGVLLGCEAPSAPEAFVVPVGDAEIGREVFDLPARSGRVCSRAGEPPYVDDDGDLGLAQEVTEPFAVQAPVAEGEHGPEPCTSWVRSHDGRSVRGGRSIRAWTTRRRWRGSPRRRWART